MNVKSKSDRIKKSIAINEVSILRQSKQASSISITSNKKNIIKKLSFRWCFSFNTSWKYGI